MSKTVLFQTIQFSISTQVNAKTVLFQVIQFSISKQLNSIWPIDRTLSSATTPSQSKPGSNGNERVLRILQGSSITGTSPLVVGAYLSAEMQLMFSITPANWAIIWLHSMRVSLWTFQLTVFFLYAQICLQINWFFLIEYFCFSLF